MFDRPDMTVRIPEHVRPATLAHLQHVVRCQPVGSHGPLVVWKMLVCHDSAAAACDHRYRGLWIRGNPHLAGLVLHRIRGLVDVYGSRPGVHLCLYPAGLGFHGGGYCVNRVLNGGFGAALDSEEIRKRLGDILVAGLVLPHSKRDLDQTWAKRRAPDQSRLRRGGMVAVQTPARFGHVGGDCCLRHIRDVRRVFVVNARHLQIAASAGCALLRPVPDLLHRPAADCVTLEAALAAAPSLRVFLAPFLLLLLVYLPPGDGRVNRWDWSCGAVNGFGLLHPE